MRVGVGVRMAERPCAGLADRVADDRHLPPEARRDDTTIINYLVHNTLNTYVYELVAKNTNPMVTTIQQRTTSGIFLCRKFVIFNHYNIQ